MKLLALLDLETTGLDPAQHRVVEIGVTTWSVVHRCTVRSWSVLMHGGPNDAEKVNRIPSGLLAADDIPGVSSPDVAWRNLQNLFGQVDAVLAHNATFDRSFIPEHFRDIAPWICTQDDISWPRASSSKKLTEIALAHGLGVSGAHRALADVELIARLLERSAELGVDIEAMLARAARPKKLFAVAAHGFDEARNTLAKEHGFRWEKPNWVRRMPPEDVMSLPFEVKEVAA